MLCSQKLSSKSSNRAVIPPPLLLKRRVKKKEIEQKLEASPTVMLIPLKAKITYFSPGPNYLPSLEVLDGLSSDRSVGASFNYWKNRTNPGESSENSSDSDDTSIKSEEEIINHNKERRLSTQAQPYHDYSEADYQTVTAPQTIQLMVPPKRKYLYPSKHKNMFRIERDEKELPDIEKINKEMVTRLRPLSEHMQSEDDANASPVEVNIRETAAKRVQRGVKERYKNVISLEDLKDSKLEKGVKFASPVEVASELLNSNARWPFKDLPNIPASGILSKDTSHSTPRAGLLAADSSFQVLAPKKKITPKPQLLKSVESIHNRVRAGFLADPEENIYPDEIQNPFRIIGRKDNMNKGKKLTRKKDVKYSFEKQLINPLRDPPPRRYSRHNRLLSVKWDIPYGEQGAQFNTKKLHKTWSMSQFRKNTKYRLRHSEITEKLSTRDQLDNIRHKLEIHSEQKLLPRISASVGKLPRKFKLHPREYENREPSIPKLDRKSIPRVVNTFLTTDDVQFKHDLAKACSIFIIRQEQVTLANGRKDWQTLTSIIINTG